MFTVGMDKQQDQIRREPRRSQPGLIALGGSSRRDKRDPGSGPPALQLWVSLEEHQDALELIMSKYRKQMLQLLEGRKREEAEPVLKVHQANSGEIESQIDRICEMGEVMRKAVQVDDEQFFKVQEKLAQLELENKELRELLLISKESFEVGREDLPD
ncbi:suppressor of IKBKE 1 [Geospiza fortis]|uniref:Suppressor of IKBKE 1 n=1 Tax=Geospiza fortis TaxID=48883 RepID=A0A6I9HQP5_GEOFO|nr:suppressor of IKBKE 1 [Geospiza fortis]